MRSKTEHPGFARGNLFKKYFYDFANQSDCNRNTDFWLIDCQKLIDLAFKMTPRNSC